MQRWVRTFLEHDRLTIVVSLLLTAAWLPLLPHLRIQADGRSLLPSSHPAVLIQNRIEHEFAGADFLVVAIEAGSAEDLFAPPALTWLFRFTKAVEALPAVAADGVRSLATDVTASWTPAGLSIAPPVATEIATAADAAAVRVKVDREPLFQRTLVGADGRSLAVSVPVQPGVDRRRAFASIEELATRELRRIESAGHAGYRLRFLGAVAAESMLAEYVLQDLLVLLPAATLLIGLILFVWFRDLRMSVLGLAEAIVCVVWTLGLMAAASRPVTLVGVLCPVILVAYCVSDTIYIAQRFREKRLSRQYPARREALEATMKDLAAPLTATSLTTCAGFLAFAVSPIPPLRDFGLFTAFGVVFALALSLLIVPAALLLCGFGEQGRAHAAPDLALRPLRMTVATVRHPKAVLGICVVLTAVFASGAVRLRIQDSWLRNFNRSSALAQTDSWFNDHYVGSNVLNAVVRVRGPEGMYAPRVLAAIEQLQRTLREMPAVGGSLSIVDCLGVASRALDRTPRLPSDAREAEDWSLVYETSDGGRRLRSYVNENRSAANVWIFLNRADYVRTRSVIDLVGRWAASVLRDAEISFGGDAYLGYVLVDSIARSLWITLLVSLILVFAIVYPLVRSLRGATLAVLPVALSVLWNFGFMGWAGLPIGVATSTFSSIALGIGVDFAIQWTARLRAVLETAPTWESAVLTTQTSTGAAILLHSSVLMCSFGLLAASAVPPNRSLGILVCVNLIVCMLATLCVLPALSTVWKQPAVHDEVTWAATVGQHR